MLARSSIKTRLSALEMYVDMPKEHRGMTLTGRLDAQHRLLLAIREDQLAFRADLNEYNQRLTRVEGRLTEVEVTLGKVLYGMVEIKNILTSREDPP